MELVPDQLADSPPAMRRKAHGRSKVTNGAELLPEVDGRSVIARRYRDITRAILADQGGEDRCSESRKQLIEDLPLPPS